jgi:hypothetical protein
LQAAEEEELAQGITEVVEEEVQEVIGLMFLERDLVEELLIPYKINF